LSSVFGPWSAVINVRQHVGALVRAMPRSHSRRCGPSGPGVMSCCSRRRLSASRTCSGNLA